VSNTAFKLHSNHLKNYTKIFNIFQHYPLIKNIKVYAMTTGRILVFFMDWESFISTLMPLDGESENIK
jgi:hypothetical protein